MAAANHPLIDAIDQPTVAEPIIPATISYEELPDWRRDNRHIRKGYRREMRPTEALLSAYSSHNETVNILSHYLAALFFLYIEIMVDVTTSRSLERTLPLRLFRFSAIFCFTISGLFHSMMNTTEELFILFNRLDYVGILIFLSSGGISVINIMFGHTFYEIRIYMLIGLIAAVILLINIFGPDFYTPAYRTTRACYFAIYALSVLVPILHFLLLNGHVDILKGLVPAMIAFAIGLFCYVFCFPECLFDYFFDYLPDSIRWIGDYFPGHFLFHIAVSIGAWFFYEEMRRLQEIEQRKLGYSVCSHKMFS